MHRTELYIVNKCKQWWATYLIVVVILMLQFNHTFGLEKLAFDHQRISNGEVWLLVTGFFVHGPWIHLLMDLAIYLSIVWFFRSRLKPITELWTLIICMFGSGLGIYYSGISWYAGLSGSLYGFWLIQLIRSYKPKQYLKIAIIAIIWLKMFWDLTPYGPDAIIAYIIGGAVVTEAHFWGSVAGTLIGIALFICEKDKTPDDSVSKVLA